MPSPDHDTCATLDAALDRLRTFVLHSSSAVERGMETYEAELREHLNGIGQVGMEVGLTQFDPGLPVLDDGRVEVARSPKRYMTAFGDVSVERGLYRSSRSGPADCPLEEGARIFNGFWTPLAAKGALIAVSELPPRRVYTLLQTLLGASASCSSLDRLPKQFNALYEEHQDEYEELIRNEDVVSDAAATVVVAVDGVMVATRERDGEKAAKKAAARTKGIRDSGPNAKEECMCAELSLYDSDGKRLLTRRAGRMPEKSWPSMKKWVEEELDDMRSRSPNLLVMAMADGSRSLWSYLPTLNADEEAVDFYHASEYLKDALDCLMGANSPTTDERYVELRHALRHERFGVDKVLAALDDLEVARKVKTRPRRGARFFRTHVERMRYAENDTQGLPLGTGVMEGTCKSLVSDRLKRSGMSWSLAGGQAILNVRGLVQSDRFDRAWELVNGSTRQIAA
jgi:hypothetical protein